MQFTLEQFTQLMALAAAITFFGFFSYHCGLRDKRKLINSAQQKQHSTACENIRLKTELAISEQRAETNARAIELLNDELEAANLIKSRQLEAARQEEEHGEWQAWQADQLAAENDALRLKVLSENQTQTIRQASSQLVLTAQLMEAFKNKESATSQRTLAKRLLNIVEHNQPTPTQEAA